MKSLKTRFTYSIVIPILAISFISSLLVIFEKRDTLFTSLKKEAMLFARGSAIGIYNLYTDTLGESIQRFFNSFKPRFLKLMGQSPETVRIALIAKNGRVIFDSLSLEAATGKTYQEDDKQHVRNKELLYDLQQNTMQVRELEIDSDSELFLSRFFYKKNPKKMLGRMLLITVPKTEIVGRHIVSVCYWVSYATVEKKVLWTTLIIITISLFFTAVGFLMAFWLSQRIVKPVEVLTEAAVKMEQGNLESRVRIFSDDELGKLGSVFNSMAKSMEDSFEKTQRQARHLKILNSELEKERILLEERVQERTYELNEAYEELKELDKAKTAFFANVSHELRTPLTFILLAVELISDGNYQEHIHYQDDVFKSMHSNVQRLNHLIGDLLDFSKIEAGKMKVRKESVLITDLIERCFLGFKSPADKQKIQIEYKRPEEPFMVSIDTDLIEKAVVNLLSNALKFTSEGGKITLSLTKTKLYYYIQVKDTGIGIPDDQLEMVFERFTQLNQGGSGRNKKFEGTGIGLSLTKEIVKLHSGSIRVESEEGKGSVFTIELPLD